MALPVNTHPDRACEPTDESGFSPHSHRRVTVSCDFGISSKCRRTWDTEYKVVHATRERNGGKIVCVFCSRALKSTGRNNPNTKYRSLDDSFFSVVDSEEKAYLLGWFASDASIRKDSIALWIHERDKAVLYRLREIICPELAILPKKKRLLGFSVSSSEMASDVCRLLDIEPGKKSGTVGFPELATDELSWAFLRGLFDGDGSIPVPKPKRESFPSPRCTLHSNSVRLLDRVASFVDIPAYRGADRLEWSGPNALDLMARLYERAELYLARKRDLYVDWCGWVPALSGRHGRGEQLRWVKTLESAVAPFKQHASDSGYDLTLVAEGKRHGNVQFYRTGLKIQPPFGWYFDLVPRSSISKSGYMLANGVGVIDRGYVGEVLVPLVKLDGNAADLPLPARIVQIIPRPIVHFQVAEVDSFEETQRGSGGFGSTEG